MYLMSYFRTDAEALHLALSADGLHWQALNGNRPILAGAVSSTRLRDPFVVRAHDGLFHLFATDGWASAAIIHATSPNLVDWSPQALVPVMAGVAGTRNCWAPECFYDHHAQCYQVLWSSTVQPAPASMGGPRAGDTSQWDHRIWASITTDFRHFTPAQLFFDPGYSVIDATVAYHAGTYLLAFKDERGENRVGTGWKAIRLCAAPQAHGPWTAISELITPPLTEGPALFRRAGRWCLVFDHFWEGYFGAMESTDGVAWASITAQMHFPPGPRHASVMEIEAELGRYLLRRLG